MAPLANNISIDPRLAIEKMLASKKSYSSKEDPKVLAQREAERKKQAQKAVSSAITKWITSGAWIQAPVVPAVIRTPVQQTVRSTELPVQTKTVAPLQSGQQSMPEWMPLIAGNVSPQSLWTLNDKEIEFAKKAKAQWYTKEQVAEFISKQRWEQPQLQEDKSILDQVKQWAKDIWGWLLTSIMKTGELATRPIQYAGEQLSKWIDYFAGTKTEPFKIAWATREQLPQVSQDVTGGRPSSLWFKWWELAWDIATTSVATAATAWLAWSALGGTQIATQAANIASKYPKLATAARLAAQWAADTQAYSLQSEWKAANIWEMWAWAGINVALWWLWALASKGLKSAAEKLQLSWLLNPSDLKKTAKAMQLSPKDIWNVSDWMLEKNMVWSKETILSKVEDFAARNYDETQRALASSTTTHKVPEAKQALTKLKNAFWWDKAEPWLEDLFKEVNDLYKKSNRWLTLSELNKVQQLQGKYLPNFTKSMEIKDTLWAEANSRLYNTVKKYIEDAASSEWIWNIRKLKKDTQVANLIKWGIASKEAADFARQLMSPFAWWAAWSFLWWASPTDDPVTWLRNVIVWAAVWKTLASKTLQSRAAKAIYNMWDKWPIWDISRRTITQFINQLYNNDK